MSDPAQSSLYSHLAEQSQLLEVGMDDLNVLIRGSGLRGIGTQGLNGCTCIVILGTAAILMAHMSLYPGAFDPNTSQDVNQASIQHIHRSLLNVQNMIRQNAGYFPPNSITWGIFSVGEPGTDTAGFVESTFRQVRDFLGRMGYPSRPAFYEDIPFDRVRPPKGELVGMFEHESPRLFLEGQMLWPRTSLASRETARASGEWWGYHLQRHTSGESRLQCRAAQETLQLPVRWEEGVQWPMIQIENTWLQAYPHSGTLVVNRRGVALRLARR